MIQFVNFFVLIIFFTTFSLAEEKEICKRVDILLKEAKNLDNSFNDPKSATILLQNSVFKKLLYLRNERPKCLNKREYIDALNQYSYYYSKNIDNRYLSKRFLEQFLEKFPDNTLVYYYIGKYYQNSLKYKDKRASENREKILDYYHKYIDLAKKNKLSIDKEVLQFLKDRGYPKAKKTWGKYLNPKNIIPSNKFKAFYIDRQNPKKVVASEDVNSVSVNYPYKDFHNIDSKYFGGYWVGNFKFKRNTKLQLNISQSWSKTRIIIDGLIIYNGDSNHILPYTFEKGEHKIEVEYINNWHTTDFTMMMTPYRKLYKINELKKSLKKLVSKDNSIWYVSIYESKKKDHSVEVILKKSTKPIILLLQSSSTVIWKIKNPHNNRINAIVLGRSSPGTQVKGKIEKKDIYYTSFNLGSSSLYPKCSCHSPRFHCEQGGSVKYTNKTIGRFLKHKIDGFNGKYGVNILTVPEIILDAKKYEEIDKKIEEVEIQRKECKKERKPDFDTIFDKPIK